jgi:exosome complex RNA-binding protein Csl4
MRRMTMMALVGALMLALVAGSAVAAPGKGTAASAKGKAVAAEKSKAGQQNSAASAKGKARAQQAQQNRKVTRVVFGTVTAVDEDSVTVAVERANKDGRGLVGKEVEFAVVEATAVERNGEEAELADVQPGDAAKVVSQGKAADKSFVAKQITAEGPEAEETTEPAPGDPA